MDAMKNNNILLYFVGANSIDIRQIELRLESTSSLCGCWMRRRLVSLGVVRGVKKWYLVCFAN